MRPRILGGALVLIVTAFLVMCAAGAPTNAQVIPSWPQFDGGPDHSGAVTDARAPGSSEVGDLTNAFIAPLPGVADGAVAFEPNVSTSSGPLDLVFSLTKDGWISAEDAHTGTVIWKHQNGPGGCHINNGGTICYTTSSPALDPNGLYVYAYGLDGRAHKYAVGTGAEVTTGGWPELTTTKPFDEKGSSALAVASVGGTSYLYVANGGYPGDRGDYQGHVTTINLNTGAQKVFNTLCSNKTIHFTESASTDCSNVQSAVWARVGVDYDAATGKVYMVTGNSVFDGSHNWGDSVIAINPDGSGTASGPVDSYTPTNQAALNSSDQDLGSTAPAIVTAPAGSSVANLGVQGGKDQKLRLLNLDDLSGQGGPGHTGGELQIMNVPQGGLVFTHPASWVDPGDSSSWVFVSTGNGISGIKLTAPGGNPTMTTQWTVNTGGTSPIIVDNVLYYLTGGGARALDPTTGQLLWSDSSGGFNLHWQSLIVADGMLYYPDSSGNLRAFSLPGNVSRISGADRYATGAAVSHTFAPGVSTAYVASGADFPDSLSGSPAAGRDGGPLLLVQPEAIPQSVKTELTRLKPQNIVVLGGTAAVSSSVQAMLVPYATSGHVTRLAGADRFGTSAAIAAGFAPHPAIVYVTTGENFPDALSAAAVAAGPNGGPLLLVTHDSIPATVATQLARLHPTKIQVIGGTVSVDAAVETQLQSYATTVQRLSGADRYGTSAAVALADGSPGRVYLAVGTGFPDGLTAAPAAGRDGSVLLLVTSAQIPEVVSSALLSISPTAATIVGGTSSVSSSVQKQLPSYLH